MFVAEYTPYPFTTGEPFAIAVRFKEAYSSKMVDYACDVTDEQYVTHKGRWQPAAVLYVGVVGGRGVPIELLDEVMNAFRGEALGPLSFACVRHLEGRVALVVRDTRRLRAYRHMLHRLFDEFVRPQLQPSTHHSIVPLGVAHVARRSTRGLPTVEDELAQPGGLLFGLYENYVVTPVTHRSERRDIVRDEAW
jgi:hypothetical protein